MKRKELKGKKISELRAMAKISGVSLKRGWKKDDIIDAILKTGKRVAKANPPSSPLKLRGEWGVRVSAEKVTPEPEKEEERGTRAKRKTTKKTRIKRKAAKPSEKTKKKVTKTTKKVEEKAKKVLAKKAEKRLTPKKEKAEKKEPKKVSLPKKIAVKKPARKAAEKIKKPEEVEKRIEIPRFEEAYPPVPTSGLPAEYGEDRIALMTVDPQRLFAYWEVRKDTHKRLGGNLALRVYDVTGVDFNGQNANSFFDINIYERVGNWYIDVRRPESDFVVDIGVTYPDGNFVTVARSNKASTPQVRVSEEEAALPHKLYEEGLPYGYEKTGDR